jgi:ligand-binding sensor domain-containing protein
VHVDETNGKNVTIGVEGERRLTDDRVMSLLRDRVGGLWVGTMEGGVNHLAPGEKHFAVLRHDPRDPASLSSNGVMSLFEDSKGRVWIGTFGGGVDRVERDGHRITHFEPDPANGSSLCGIRRRHRGGIWIATENDCACSTNFRAFPRFPSQRALHRVCRTTPFMRCIPTRQGASGLAQAAADSHMVVAHPRIGSHSL